MAVVDVAKFSKERIYRTHAPGAQVLRDLEFLRTFDARQEKHQSQMGRLGCGSLLAAVALLILSASTSDWENPTLAQVAIIGSLLLILAGIISFILRARHEQLNLENRRYELATRLVQMLQADITHGEPLTIEIDLRPGTHPDKYAGQGMTPSGWTVKSYVDRWLHLQGRLMDGTHLRLEMTERIDMRSRTRRSSSGKSKTKSKTLSDALVRVRLQVKPEKYKYLGWLGARAREAVQLPPGTRLKALSVEEDRLDLSVLVSNPWGMESNPDQVDAIRVVAMSLLSLYQVLNLSRAIAKKAAHA